MNSPTASPSGTKFGHRAHDAIFNKVHGDNLVYNTCWEDPRLDREMLCLQPDSRVVMITSAGCNALDYLLCDPQEIHAVDMNPRQNALLQLKVALIENDNFEDLFQTFGYGVNSEFRSLLKKLKGNLHPYAYKFWKQKSDYFKANKVCSSFYYRGTAGRMALIARHSFLRRNKRLRQYVNALLNVESIEDQKSLYEEVQGTLWSGFVSWLVRQPMVMTLLGVPRAQIRLMSEQFPGGLTGYVRDKLEHVCTRVPFSDNYFWRAYITGRYTETCCPNYLRRENQGILQERVSRITTHSTTIANFLRENPAKYSHFVLLDHQDWLASHRPDDLEDEWRLILENSRPGTRILMRSASPSIDFIPEFARNRLQLNVELAESLHAKDRVGTYGSTLLADVIA